MAKQDLLHRIVNPGVVAVIRAQSSEQLSDLAAALLAGGMPGMEVTMTTPHALDVIASVTKRFGKQILMGVGSVLDDTTARLAILAGAEFVVTPVMRPDVIACCRRYGKPCIAGAYTPTEALAAYEAGADFIKIFPADGLGPNFIKAIKAPMPQLEIIPTGGVSVDTCGAFIRAGCAAVAAGSSLLDPAAMKAGDWATISATAKAFVEAVAKARGT